MATETTDEVVERLDRDLRYLACPHQDSGSDGMLTIYRVKCAECRIAALREALRIGREQADPNDPFANFQHALDRAGVVSAEQLSELAERITCKIESLLTDKYTNSFRIACGIIKQELADAIRNLSTEE